MAMFGSTMGTIEVLVNDSVIWLMDLGPGRSAYWTTVQVPLPISTSCLVQFRGTTGTSWSSDMALDELIVDDGTCRRTDSIADNYDASALVDDGTCIYTGCTDPLLETTGH